MIKKEMIAMLLAGGPGDGLGVLTARTAKPALFFGGRYRIIDFPLSNCINSELDTVGVLTRPRPRRLREHIGIGVPWDLDRDAGGVSILPFGGVGCAESWYPGAVGAVLQNLEYIEDFHPEYVLILPGGHVYKMDYELMLRAHKAGRADVSIAVHPVVSGRSGSRCMIRTDENGCVTRLGGRPGPQSGVSVSMGIFIFRWPLLKELLQELADVPGCDFEKHVLPLCLKRGYRVCSYEFQGYWKSLDTLDAYWTANMELVSLIPEFNLYEECWRIYTKGDILPPQYLADGARVTESIIGEGAEICGEVHHSVIGAGVRIGAGAMVRDSVIMRGCEIGEGTQVTKAILAEDTRVGSGVLIGDGEYAESMLDPRVYRSELATLGEGSVVPNNVVIGKNTAVSGVTAAADYPDGRLPGGGFILNPYAPDNGGNVMGKAGDVR